MKATLKDGTVLEGAPEEVERLLKALAPARAAALPPPAPVPLQPVVPYLPHPWVTRGPWWESEDPYRITCSSSSDSTGGVQ